MDFLGAYNAISRRSGHIKFTTVPNHTYLKLKMFGPHGIITMSASFQATYAREKANCELTSAQAATRELVELRGGIDSRDGPYAPKASSDTFKSIEDMKDVQIDDADPFKHVRIGRRSLANKKTPLSTSSEPIATSSLGSPRTCWESQGNLSSTP